MVGFSVSLTVTLKPHEPCTEVSGSVAVQVTRVVPTAKNEPLAGKQLTVAHDSERGQEHSGRERYFLARAWQEMKHHERALDEYEAMVLELPLSYYMLHAYSRLKLADPKRASDALGRAKQLSETQPFEFENRSEFSTPEFVRGMELLRVGDIDLARGELSALGIGSGDENSSLLWGIALLYAKAGAAFGE